MIETCQQYVKRRLVEGWKIVGRFGYSVFLSPSDGSFIRPVDLRNDVETLRPSAAGDSTEWICVGDAVNYQMVDEASQDGDTTYVKEWASGEKDLYNIDNHSIGSGTINFVKLYAWLKYYSSTQKQMHIGVKSGETEDWGSEVGTSSSWAEYTRQFDTDPNTGSAWTWEAIDALQIGVKAGESDWLGGACTQIYVEIDYTIAVAGWTGKISGVTNPAKVMGVDVADIAKVKGVGSA